jgi:hypothetical protein
MWKLAKAMEQFKKYKNIFDMQFPIFAISTNNKRIWTEDKITYVETASGVYVLDNKNIKGDTLGQRRLRIKNSKLYIPRAVVHSIPQLIKSKYKNYIDNNGNTFKYIKHTVVPLKYYKVDKIVETDKGCVLKFKNLNNPIILSCREAYGVNYVGFLLTQIGYITYEYSEVYKADTWRKI